MDLRNQCHFVHNKLNNDLTMQLHLLWRNFEEKYVRESVTEQIAKLKVRYGKNNIKRVIPGNQYSR